ncbi:lateral signaling target protein 2 homolog isoform X2 [Nasonia vitripennis]|uniref:Uncharacterized protein n=1 Tax=Nasonia vitripennis TaxID=7425 RepID=A0A7M7GHA0_NASVI|nr:lateral signaling target protein 2 homolog isoform X2 [Nasonia vitripennis]
MSDPSAARFDGTMLKFLTHKLRTHSLNEDPNQEKADDDHDSGTESDDEFQNGGDIADELSTAMDSLEEAGAARDSAVPSDADLGASPPSTTTTPSSVFGFQHQMPSSSSGCSSTETPPIEQSYEFLLRLAQTDQHSSEEELEVINGPKVVEAAPTLASTSTAQTPLLVRPNAAPEKRKWSEANSSSAGCSSQSQHKQTDGDGIVGTTYSAPVSRTGREAGSGSSDEEGLCYSRSGSAISQPVQFRSSPPTDAHKPVRSLSPPPKLFHASAYSSSSACIASGSSSEYPPRFHHHRPRSRPRPHSQYHSYTNLDSHHHHHLHHHHQSHGHHSQQPLLPPPSQLLQQQQQDLADLDVIGACSPRKRHRPPHRLPRPCLDFEKMQQLKAQAVTTWRHTSEHGKELSVFCW